MPDKGPFSIEVLPRSSFKLLCDALGAELVDFRQEPVEISADMKEGEMINIRFTCVVIDYQM